MVIATVTEAGTWNRYPVAVRTISSGDFLVGIAVLSASDLYPMAVDKSTSKRRSWISNDGESWTLIDFFENQGGNFGIRAKVILGAP